MISIKRDIKIRINNLEGKHHFSDHLVQNNLFDVEEIVTQGS